MPRRRGRGGARIQLTTKIDGLSALLKKTSDSGRHLYSYPWRKAMRAVRDLVEIRLWDRVPLGETHHLADSLHTSMDFRPVPLWVRFSADATGRDGFRYGWALNSSKKRTYTYRYSRRIGQPTRKWFTGALSGARAKINKLVEAAAAEIERRWSE